MAKRVYKEETIRKRVIAALDKAGFAFAIPAFTREPTKGAIIVSAEDFDDDKGYAADYYGEYRGGYPWINPEIEAIVEKNGASIEWENAGAIAIYPWN